MNPMPSLRVLSLCLVAAGSVSGLASAATNQPAGPVPAATASDQSLPLASHRNAEFLHSTVPGMSIPDPIRARMARVGSGPLARKEGVHIAQEALSAVKSRVAGAYIMPPLGRYEMALEVLEGIERAPDATVVVH